MPADLSTVEAALRNARGYVNDALFVLGGELKKKRGKVDTAMDRLGKATASLDYALQAVRDDISAPDTGLVEALAQVGVPLEVLRGQIETKPYAEMTAGFQTEIVAATEIIRAALAAARAEAGRTDR